MYKNINQVIQTLFTKKSLLEVLLRVEKLFDDINLYVYPNWVSGEVLEGPRLTRYWVDVVLKYDTEQMPDPNGAKILEKLGCDVVYAKESMLVPVEVNEPDDLNANNRPKMKKTKVWVLYLSIPRRFIDEADIEDLQIFDEEMDIDVEDLSDAEDMGLEDD